MFRYIICGISESYCDLSLNSLAITIFFNTFASKNNSGTRNRIKLVLAKKEEKIIYFTMAKVKPFIKWVGGKTQLIEQLDAQLPADFGNWKNATYIEPFVGGGAMLFYMLQRYPNIQHAIINDINLDLTICYQTVKNNPEQLIDSLHDIENAYLALQTEEEKKDFFMAVRKRYNEKNLDPIENTTKFFFLNKTCFNGLYRVNKKGLFNVPFGKYTNPTICDPEIIREDSKLLQRVEILNGDFETTLEYAHGNTLFYFDPPYRPLSDTSSFNNYTKEAFNDDAQIRLKRYCDRIHNAGFKFMLSNSDCKGKNETDNFFDVLYEAYKIERVWASRSINSNSNKRGKLTEILVHNYTETKEKALDNIFHLKNVTSNQKNIAMAVNL